MLEIPSMLGMVCQERRVKPIYNLAWWLIPVAGKLRHKNCPGFIVSFGPVWVTCIKIWRGGRLKYIFYSILLHSKEKVVFVNKKQRLCSGT